MSFSDRIGVTRPKTVLQTEDMDTDLRMAFGRRVSKATSTIMTMTGSTMTLCQTFSSIS